MPLRVFPLLTILLLASACGGVGGAISEFDDLLLPPRQGDIHLSYRDKRVLNPWILGLARRRVLPESQLMAMGRADDADEVGAAYLRLALVLHRDQWDFHQVLAVTALGNIAAAIGPGPLPQPEKGTVDPDALPDLGPDFRQRLQETLQAGDPGLLRQRIGKDLLFALRHESDRLREVTARQLTRLWDAAGLRLAFKVEPKSLSYTRTLIELAGQVDPAKAAGRNPGESIPALIYPFTQVEELTTPQMESLEMVAMHSLSRLLERPVSYDPESYRAWWREFGRQATGRERAGDGGR